MSKATTAPPSLAKLSAAHECLERAERALAQARGSDKDNWRYIYAHMAALRVAAAVLAMRAHPRSVRGRRNAWKLLADVAPELAEWADFFAAGAAKRTTAELATSAVVTSREADDLIRAAEQFIAVAEQCLGLPSVVAQ